jgi:hypothetical protein
LAETKKVGREPGAGGAGKASQAAASLFKDLIQKTAGSILQTAGKKYLGLELNPDMLGDAANTVLTSVSEGIARATKSKTAGAAPTVADAKKDDLTKAARHVAQAFLESRIGGFMGKAPTPASEDLAKLDPKKTYYTETKDKSGLYHLAGSATADHLISLAFGRLSMTGDFGEGVKDAIVSAIFGRPFEKEKPLGEIGSDTNWQEFGRRVANGITDDLGRGVRVPKEVRAVMQKAIATIAGTAPTEAAAPVEDKPPANQTTVDTSGPAQPKAPDQAQTSSGERRATADTNAFATYFLNRTAKTKEEKEAKRKTEDVVNWAATVLGVKVDDVSMKRALNKLQPILEKLPADDPLTATAMLFRELQKAQPKGSANYLRFESMADVMEGLGDRFAEIQQQTQGKVSFDNLSPSLARSIQKAMDFGVTAFVASAVGAKNKAFGPDDVEVKRVQVALGHISENFLSKDSPNANKAYQRRRQAERPEVTSPPLKFINPDDLKGSAAAITDRLMQALGDDPPKTPELKAQIQEVVEGIISATPRDSLAVAGRAFTYLAEHGIDGKQGRAMVLGTRYQGVVRALDEKAHEVGEIRGAYRGAAQEADALEKKIAASKQKVVALGAEPQSAERDQKIADEESLQKTLTANLGEQKKTIEGLQPRLKQALTEYNEAKAQTESLAVGMLAEVAQAIHDPAALHKKLDAQAKEMGIPIEEEEPQPTSDGGGKDRPPGGPGGPSDRPDQERKIPLAKRRAAECAKILNDPCLSVQDKIFMFMMVYAAYSDLEREDKLRELNALEERKADLDARRDQKLTKKNELEKDLEQQKDKLQGIEEKMKAAGVDPKDLDEKVKAAGGDQAALQKVVKDLQAQGVSPQALQLVEQRTTAQNGLSRLNTNLRDASREYENSEKETGSTKNRETLFLELDRITKWRDQIMQMARSMLEESNRLVERIWR